jgi:hypothetical protein
MCQVAAEPFRNCGDLAFEAILNESIKSGWNE